MEMVVNSTEREREMREKTENEKCQYSGESEGEESEI